MRITALVVASFLVLPLLGCILDTSGELIVESSERQNPFSEDYNTTGGFTITIKNYNDAAKHPELNITVPSEIQLLVESPGIVTSADDIEPVTFTEVSNDGEYRVYNLKPTDSTYKLGSGKKFVFYFTVSTGSGSVQSTGNVKLYGDGKLTDDRDFDWKVGAGTIV